MRKRFLAIVVIGVLAIFLVLQLGCSPTAPDFVTVIGQITQTVVTQTPNGVRVTVGFNVSGPEGTRFTAYIWMGGLANLQPRQKSGTAKDFKELWPVDFNSSSLGFGGTVLLMEGGSDSWIGYGTPPGPSNPKFLDLRKF